VELDKSSPGDRVKALCGAVLGDKICSLILSLRTLYIGRDALHRDPSLCEGPFSDPTISSGKFFSVFSAPLATLSRVEGARAVNYSFFAFSKFSPFRDDPLSNFFLDLISRF
jgi:hypothetical protein